MATGVVTRLSTPAAFVTALIWLAPTSSAEAAMIVLFSDEPRCRRQQISWDLTPAGMGTINLRLDPVSTGKCEAAVGSTTITPLMGGGFGGGGGGGVLGGLASGRWSGSITPPYGALEFEFEFVLVPEADLFDLLPSFTGDTPPIGGAGGNDGTTGFIGGSPGLPLGSSLMMFSSLLDGDFEQIPSGNFSGRQSLDDQTLTVVPEPGSFLLFATGLVLAVRCLRRR